MSRWRDLLAPLTALVLAPAACNGAQTTSPAGSAGAPPASSAEPAPGPTKNPTPEGVEPAEPADPADPAPLPPNAPATVGARAPDFTLPDLDGNPHKLGDHAGKIVVLEWFNPGCPFVKYAHEKGPLATMANEVAGEDLVWLAVNSGAPGKQGHGVETNRAAARAFGIFHPILLDPDGAVGKAYGAEKTPHMFVIGPDQTLLYAGGIDNAPFGEVDGDAPAENYVAAALAALRSDRPVPVKSTPSYGCTVKYAS